MIRFASFLSLLMIITSSVSAVWTEDNFNGMVSDTQRLLPENLQWALRRYSSEFESGKLPCNLSQFNDEQLLESIMSDVDDAVIAFTDGMSYGKGSRLLGRIARKIMYMHSLLRDISKIDNQSWQTDYSIFLQHHRKNMRIRWKGYELLPHNDSELRKMLFSSVQNTRRFDSKLANTLNYENKDISEYGVMSIPFGIGSITYSNAVNSIAYTWLYVWKQAGGL
jgi:hypothetical protein